MKKILLALTLLFATFTVHADGEYDGIYSLELPSIGVFGYMTIQEHDGTTVAVGVSNYANRPHWYASIGQRGGTNVVRLSTIIYEVYSVLDVEFFINGDVIITLVECVSNATFVCTQPNGTKITGHKVW